METRRESVPHVVVVGAGFGGLAAVRALRRAPCRITLVDRRNYHLFQPLLYQVATASLSPADISWPIRHIVSDQKNVRVVLGRVADVDRAAQTVRLEDGGRIPYDRLVVATGARHSYFGRDAWEEDAPGLKKIDDATDIRHRILLAFERAERASDEDERRRLLTFAIVGGGPTGVEMAGAIAELARQTLADEFHAIDPTTARVVLVEGGARVLPAFHPTLSERARRDLERLGVDVLLERRVTDVRPDGIVMDGTELVPARTVIWAAGVAASPAGRWLGAETDRSGRVKVTTHLTLFGDDCVHVIGDAAAVATAGGTVPGVAAAAKQMGTYVGREIAGQLGGRPASQPFRYRNPGIMATIGRNKAIAEFGGVRIAGFPAWVLWATAHIYFLVGNRNRALVALSWLWTYLFNTRGARLITDQPAPRAEAPAE